ncbi:hypothetical protein GCM10029963_79920 [Micromonospora andamanensis]|uniref:hypothetical protein n=1 Tax=Micromonospora andamanensis TaxID=1287068 RepID=UPI001A4BC368|nr:hypothetical protein [Micromonospora andamanensis]GIJ40527.1 hypothetical protein Vwe01_38520 [Micromonospora andamanensis]
MARAAPAVTGKARLRGICPALMAALLGVGGCTGSATPDVPAPDRSGPVYPTLGDVAGLPTPGESPGRDDHEGEELTASPPSAAQASRVAARFARTWVRSDLPAEEWLRQVAEVCDKGFAEQLRTVDPARIPATWVTGQPVTTRPPKDGVAEYEITTDSGTLTVTVAALGGRWLVTGNDFRRAIG